MGGEEFFQWHILPYAQALRSLPTWVLVKIPLLELFGCFQRYLSIK